MHGTGRVAAIWPNNDTLAQEHQMMQSLYMWMIMNLQRRCEHVICF